MSHLPGQVTFQRGGSHHGDKGSNRTLRDRVMRGPDRGDLSKQEAFEWCPRL